MGFLKQVRGNIIFYQIPSFVGTGLVDHGFVGRHGGVSEGPYSSLNLAFHVEDDPERVIKNRERLAEVFEADLDHWVAGNQVHGCKVHLVTDEDRGKGARTLTTALAETDAIITRQPGILLTSYYADCVPVFFLDPVHRAVGLAHAGWKGTVEQIVVATLKAMSEYFATLPGDCLVGIGPCIGPCCFQVKRQVYERFAEVFTDAGELIIKNGHDSWSIDLAGCNRRLMIEQGVKKENITLSGLCTSCENQDFFSYRKGDGTAGRQASVIMLKK